MGLMMVAHYDERGKRISLIKNIQKIFWSLINWIAKGQQKKGIICSA